MDNERLRAELKDLKSREALLRKSALRKTGDENNDQSASNSRAMRYTWLGAEFAAIFFAFVYGGNLLDQKLGTKPWLVLVGICAGFGIALYRLIFVARRLSE